MNNLNAAQYTDDPQWQVVIEYYLNLDSEWKRELYKKSLSVDQLDYLEELLGEKEELLLEHEEERLLTYDQAEQLEYHESQHGAEAEPLYYNQVDDPAEIYREHEDFVHPESLKQVENIDEGFLYKIGLLFRKMKAIFLSILLLVIVSGVGVYYNGGFGETVEKSKLALANSLYNDYDSWIDYMLEDGADTSANADPDQDGLRNLDEYNYSTDPNKSDMDGNGVIDGVDVLSGNFLEGDMIDSVDRIALVYYLQQLGLQKAFESESVSPQNYLSEFLDTSEESFVKLNQQGEGLLIQWGFDGSADQFVINQKSSAIQYKETAVPGQGGNSYLFVPKSLLDLEKLSYQDEIYINSQTNMGREVNWKFVVVSKNFYNPLEVEQYVSRGATELSLATLNDDGTILVVRARLANVSEVEQEDVPSDGEVDEDKKISEGEK